MHYTASKLRIIYLSNPDYHIIKLTFLLLKNTNLVRREEIEVKEVKYSSGLLFYRLGNDNCKKTHFNSTWEVSIPSKSFTQPGGQPADQSFAPGFCTCPGSLCALCLHTALLLCQLHQGSALWPAHQHPLGHRVSQYNKQQENY